MATLIYFSGAKIVVPPNRLVVIMLLIILRISPLRPPPFPSAKQKHWMFDWQILLLSVSEESSLFRDFFFIKKIGVTCTQQSSQIFSLQLNVCIYTLYNHLPNQDVEVFNIWEDMS